MVLPDDVAIALKYVITYDKYTIEIILLLLMIASKNCLFSFCKESN